MIVPAALIAVLTYFSYLDFKTREVDDKLTYGLLGAGIVYQAGVWLTGGNSGALLTSLLVGAVFFLFGYVMFRTHQWGGADVIVLAAMGVFLGNSLEFIYGYFIDIFIVAFVFSLLWAFYEAMKNLKVRKGFVKLVKKDRMELLYLVVMAGVLLILGLGMMSYWMGLGIALAVGAPLYWLVPVIPSFWLLLKFVKVVEVESFRINRKASELVEYDVLIEDLWLDGKKAVRVPAKEAKGARKGKRVIVDSSDPNGLTPGQVERIRKLVKEGKLEDGFVVKWGLPFIPVFPLALVVALLWGNLLRFLFV